MSLHNIFYIYVCVTIYANITCLDISLTNSNSGAIFIILKISLYEAIDEAYAVSTLGSSRC